MNKINKIIIAVSRSFSAPLFTFLISFIGIYHYGKNIWGEFIQLFTWILLIAFLATFGNKDYLLRKYSKNPSKIAFYFTQNLLSRIILLTISIVLFFFFPFRIALASTILIILIFIYQSFESLIIYNQKFLRQLIAESIGFLIVVTYFLGSETYNLETLIYVFSISFFFKISFLIIYIKKYFFFKNVSFSIRELRHSSPFFLIILSGFIASKIDLYIVNIVMSKKSISEYQIAITAFLLMQSISYLLILPFNKHLYRINMNAVKKIQKNLTLISFPIVALGTFSIWYILEKLVFLNLPITFYIFGALASLPTYFFIITIMMYYRNKKENIILKINFISAFINLILTFILIKKMGIVGAMIAVAITQFIILFFYKFKIIK